MTSPRPLAALLLGAALACALSPTITRADVGPVGPSDVYAYFGSQSDAFQLSSPGAPAGPAWGPVVPLPTGGTFLPPLPGMPSPTVAPTNSYPFGGVANAGAFTDAFPGNTATYSILGTLNPSFIGFFEGAEIDLTMTLKQVGTSSYAYLELDFSIDYYLTNNTLPAALNSVLLTQSFNVSGEVETGPGAFAQFGGDIHYWEISGGFQGKSMGSVTFSYLNTTGGPFSTTVSSSAYIGIPPGNLGLSDPDFIRITGSFFVAGDPSTINVQSIRSVPEPSALGLLLLGSGAMLLLRRRRAAAL